MVLFDMTCSIQTLLKTINTLMKLVYLGQRVLPRHKNNLGNQLGIWIRLHSMNLTSKFLGSISNWSLKNYDLWTKPLWFEIGSHRLRNRQMTSWQGCTYAIYHGWTLCVLWVARWAHHWLDLVWPDLLSSQALYHCLCQRVYWLFMSEFFPPDASDGTTPVSDSCCYEGMHFL